MFQTITGSKRRIASASAANGTKTLGSRGLPAAEGNDGPDRFYDPEGPRTLQEPVDRTQHAAEGEAEHVPVASIFQCVTDEHSCEGQEAEPGKRVHCRSLQAGAAAERSGQHAARQLSLARPIMPFVC
jgi:hypothetical protein